jgi:cobalamin biosynthesis protein cbiD
MILIFGGTTEGRIAIKTLEQGDGHYYYSTRGSNQDVECVNGEHISGAMTENDMVEFCVLHGIRAIVDAAHPFAENLRDTIASASKRLKIPVIRLERIYGKMPENAILCADYNDAINKLKSNDIKRLLALTGVQTIEKLKPFWEKHYTVFRILDRDESRLKATQSGFPQKQIVYYNQESIDQLITTIHPDAIITKESGESGGWEEKINAAKRYDITAYIVKRPKIPAEFITVTGPIGLRRTIEKLVPGFYKLKSGFTTGSCATAAAKAALIALITGEKSKEVEFALPSREIVSLQVANVYINEYSATATVIKDAGDDPDVTDGHEVCATIRLTDNGVVTIKGGKGVGIVTLPGTGLEIGEAAINVTPRKMLENELSTLYPKGVEVTISVPDGEELAKKTFNPRIGITGGISIIGTSGVVMPFSHKAFIDAIQRQLEVAKAMGLERIILNSGARSERIIHTLYPGVCTQGCIHYGNAVGETVTLAAKMGIKKLTIGLMIGKAVKLAEGNMDTHSHNVTINRVFLADVAKRCGCAPETVAAIEKINMARELWGMLTGNDGDRFFHSILEKCHKWCRKLFPKGELELVLIRDDDTIFDRIKHSGDGSK